MNKRTINMIIARKMKAWWSSIDNEELRSKVEKSTVVTGGCITSMLLNEKINDFDIYMKDYSVLKSLAEYYVEKFLHNRSALSVKLIEEDDIRKEKRIKIKIKSAGIAEENTRPPEESQDYLNDICPIEEKEEESEISSDNKYRPVFLSSNAVTLSQNIQFVLRFYGEPDKIHENYDFAHCTNYWTKDSGVVLKQKALEATLAKELRYIGSRYPLCSIIRTRKFIKRGWWINAGQYVKMVMHLQEFNLKDLKVLEDQLTGVDIAYFQEILDILKTKAEKDNSEELDSAYIIEIIDRMF